MATSVMYTNLCDSIFAVISPPCNDGGTGDSSLAAQREMGLGIDERLVYVESV